MLDAYTWYTKLVEKRSFTKAAEDLGVSQQTLSARLASLERELDAKLLVRGNPLSLTPAGMAFLVYAQEQQQAQQDMLRQIGEVTGGGCGMLKVGIAHARGHFLMPSICKLMLQSMPELTVKLVEGTNREVIRMAERGEVDAVIGRFGNSHPGVDVMPLYEEEMVLAVHPDLLERTLEIPADQALAKIADEGLGVLQRLPFVLGTVDDISGRIGYSELKNAGIRAHVVATSESMATLIAMAEQGLGAVFAPSNAFGTASEQGQQLLHIPLSAQARYTISLGIPMQTPDWQALDELKKALATVAATL
ncbi:MAG: LysR family transcriptional regulator [Coriobacteriia bacterium]|nr:LysR family transcriptional regulator [Coriobacteriia bacterium]